MLRVDERQLSWAIFDDELIFCRQSELKEYDYDGVVNNYHALLKIDKRRYTSNGALF